jgi:hypothetical protein
MAHQSTAWGSLEAGASQQAHSRNRWIWAIPILIVALLGAAAFWHVFPAWTGRNATGASLGADFSLELERAGSDYRVTWDPHSPVVLAAKRGTLLIKDGPFEKELQLDRDQLLTAGVVYAPATTDVTFRLELLGGPETAVAGIRLLAGSRPEVVAESPAPEETAPPVATGQPPADQPAQSAEQPAPPAEQPAPSAADQPAASDAPTTLAAAAPKPDEMPVPAR